MLTDCQSIIPGNGDSRERPHVIEHQAERLQRHLCGFTRQVMDVKSGCIESGGDDDSIRSLPVLETAPLLHILMSGILQMEKQGLVKLSELGAEMGRSCRRGLATGNRVPSREIDGNGI